MRVVPTTRTADLAARHPETIPVLLRHGIDFWCGGRRSLESFCAEKGLDFAALRRELEEAIGDPRSAEPDWLEAPLSKLVAHLVDVFHARLRRTLPALQVMARRTAERRGSRQHALYRQLAEAVTGLGEHLLSHIREEENVLFPGILQLDAASTARPPRGPTLLEPLEAPIVILELEHEETGASLERLRRLTGAFTAPAGANRIERGLFRGLAELEEETCLHMHLENNLLFPRALERAATLSRG